MTEGAKLAREQTIKGIRDRLNACLMLLDELTENLPDDGPPVDEVNAPAVVRLVREALDGTMGDDQVYEAAKLVSREWMRQKLTTEGLIPVPTDGAPS